MDEISHNAYYQHIVYVKFERHKYFKDKLLIHPIAYQNARPI